MQLALRAASGIFLRVECSLHFCPLGLLLRLRVGERVQSLEHKTFLFRTRLVAFFTVFFAGAQRLRFCQWRLPDVVDVEPPCRLYRVRRLTFGRIFGRIFAFTCAAPLPAPAPCRSGGVGRMPVVLEQKL